MADVEVANAPERQRYEARLDARPAGFAAYRERPGVIAFVHTEVEPGYEGQGVGGALVGYALADARDRGLAVLPFCRFVRGYLERHPELVDLVPEPERGRFGL